MWYKDRRGRRGRPGYPQDTRLQGCKIDGNASTQRQEPGNACRQSRLKRQQHRDKYDPRYVSGTENGSRRPSSLPPTADIFIHQHRVHSPGASKVSVSSSIFRERQLTSCISLSSGLGDMTSASSPRFYVPSGPPGALVDTFDRGCEFAPNGYLHFVYLQRSVSSAA